MRFYFRSTVDGTHWVLGQGQGLELDSFNQHCKRLTQVRGEGPGLVSGLEWSQISSVFKRLPPLATKPATKQRSEWWREWPLVAGHRSVWAGPIRHGGCLVAVLAPRSLAVPSLGGQLEPRDTSHLTHSDSQNIHMADHVTVDRWIVGSSLPGPHLGW